MLQGRARFKVAVKEMRTQSVSFLRKKNLAKYNLSGDGHELSLELVVLKRVPLWGG